MHILIEKLIEYEKREETDPKNCIYDETKGLWLWGENKEILVKSKNPNCPKRSTKKMEVVETGEDLK